MPITDILSKNCELYGDEVCLVEINPPADIPKRITWKDYRLSSPKRKALFPPRDNMGGFERKSTVSPICSLQEELKRATRWQSF